MVVVGGGDKLPGNSLWWMGPWGACRAWVSGWVWEAVWYGVWGWRDLIETQRVTSAPVVTCM